MPPPANHPDRPLTGITLIILGLFLFAIQDLVIKYFSDRYSVLQIVFIRGVVGIALLSVVVYVATGWRGFATRKPGLLMFKGLCGFLSYLAYYLAIAAMPLAEVVTIVFAAPIIVTIMSALLLKETVGIRRWGAVLVGFVGIVVVVGPDGRIGNPAVVLALLAALTYACSSLATRFIGPNDKPSTISLYSMAVFLVGSGVASVLVTVAGSGVVSGDPSAQFLLRPWVVPETVDGLLMVFLGVNAAAGFYCLCKAYWVAPASTVAPFEYTYIIWAVLFGALIWSEVPRATTVIGVELLIASSLYILHRELIARDELRRAHRPKPGAFPAVKSPA